jgi:hypothetical protein
VGPRRRVGRIKHFHESLRLPLKEGTKDKISAVMEPGESRLDFIRASIDNEIQRRWREKDSDRLSDSIGYSDSNDPPQDSD